MIYLSWFAKQTSLWRLNMNDDSPRLLEESPDAIACRLMQKVHNQDGLPEIAIGLIFLTTAALQWLQVAFPFGSFVYKYAALGLGILVPALILGSQWAIKTVRRKFLIERVGYVELKAVNRKLFWTVFGIAFLVACAMTFAIAARSVPPRSWLLATTGLSGGILSVYAGRLPRYVIGGVLMAAIGIVLGLIRISVEAGFTILFGFMGLLSLVSGCVVFSLFMRKPAAPGE
jgi:hypothetical protein